MRIFLTESSYFHKFVFDDMAPGCGRKKPLLQSHGPTGRTDPLRRDVTILVSCIAVGHNVFARSDYFVERASSIVLVI